MPMYQYACKSCESEFEKRLRMAQAGDIQTCPVCGSQETRKRIGSIAINGGVKAPARATRPVSSPFS